MFIIQLRKLREESLAREIFEEQKNHDWPGLAQEVSRICQDIGLEDVNSCEVSKDKVNEIIFYHHYTVHQMRGSEGQFSFTHAPPMCPTILETLGPKEVKYVHLNQTGPLGAPLGPLKPP